MSAILEVSRQRVLALTRTVWCVELGAGKGKRVAMPGSGSRTPIFTGENMDATLTTHPSADAGAKMDVAEPKVECAVLVLIEAQPDQVRGLIVRTDRPADTVNWFLGIGTNVDEVRERVQILMSLAHNTRVASWAKDSNIASLSVIEAVEFVHADIDGAKIVLCYRQGEWEANHWNPVGREDFASWKVSPVLADNRERYYTSNAAPHRVVGVVGV